MEENLKIMFYKIILIIIFVFSPFLSVCAVNYGSGGYGSSLYSATPADVTGPVISSVVASVSTSSATITWTTNEASTSQVEYGATISYGTTTTLDASLVTSHSVVVSSLSSGTYHYRVISKDAANNQTLSSDGTFVIADSTPPPSSVVVAPIGAVPVVFLQQSSSLPSSLAVGAVAEFAFTKNLSYGKKDTEVYYLQKYLNKQGFFVATSGVGSPGKETNYFGNATRKAVISFQKKNKIKPSTGFFGPITRAFIENK
jgi:hypothetical protein